MRVENLNCDEYKNAKRPAGCSPALLGVSVEREYQSSRVLDCGDVVLGAVWRRTLEQIAAAVTAARKSGAQKLWMCRHSLGGAIARVLTLQIASIHVSAVGCSVWLLL